MHGTRFLNYGNIFIYAIMAYISSMWLGFPFIFKAVWALESKYKEDFCLILPGGFRIIFSDFFPLSEPAGVRCSRSAAFGWQSELRTTQDGDTRTTDEENTPWIFSKDSWNWYSYSAAGKSISQQSGDLDLELFCIGRPSPLPVGIQRYCRKIAWAYSHYRGIQRAETVFTLNPSLTKTNCSKMR